MNPSNSPLKRRHPAHLPTTVLLAALLAPLSIHAAPPQKTAVNPPPSAELSYTLKASFGGIPLGGEAKVNWTKEGGNYQVATNARASLFGKVLEENSAGTVDGSGLAPASWNIKRYRKQVVGANFDRAAGTINFTDGGEPQAIKGGEQDRGSAIWQLISMARANPARFKNGSTWRFPVAGQRDVEIWTFVVDKREKIRLPQGETTALHLTKAPAADSKEQRIDIWLAPSMEWYPVRLRYTEGNGDYIEQTLESVRKS